MFFRAIVLSCIAVFLFVNYALAAPASFEQAKAELRRYVYHDRNQSDFGDFYCGCQWQWVGRSGGRVDLASCGYQVRAQQTRAERIEWEHVMPAHSFGQQRLCWQQGGRANCTANDPVFSRIEADMHNLTPAIGEVNGDRSNFRFGVLPATTPQYGQCNVQVDFKGRVVEPRDQIKGMIARIYFYMHDRYDLSMSRQQQQLLMAWDRQFPVSEWELERDRRIAARIGHHNPFVTGERHWSLQYRNQAEGIAKPEHNNAVNQPALSAPVRGNKRSKVYHLSTCPAYQSLKPENIEEFSSEQQAIQAGYRRAGNCR
ncbi:endonuclease [Chromatiaceae bacterium AAb-1]|nr:endonuclease [Chromatiaceae bacterium AAb-1]